MMPSYGHSGLCYLHCMAYLEPPVTTAGPVGGAVLIVMRCTPGKMITQFSQSTTLVPVEHEHLYKTTDSTTC